LSIVEILQSERQNLGNNLRGVVLTDYIKKEFLAVSEIDKIKKQYKGMVKFS
jgi:hypothetical protein